jgi:hypothetical protein
MATTMAYTKDSAASRDGQPVRKKLKTSDLPLASATRAAIEGLAYTFKKKGGYDSLRKQVWEDLEKSVSFPVYMLKCATYVGYRISKQISRAPSLMSPNKSLRRTQTHF